MRILVVGGSGLIGRRLCEQLHEKGYSVSILSRTQTDNAECKTYYWNLNTHEIDKEAIETADYIINLAGENIGDGRWTSERKKEIIDSRVKTGEFLLAKTKELNNAIVGYISASAIGYYGATTTDNIFEENHRHADDFLGITCQLWELTADQFEELGIRTVKIRTGVVLTKQGGALAKMALPVKLSIGSAIGSGRQYIPWIHLDDLCRIYIKAIEDTTMNGAYNAVAPQHQTNKSFMKTLAKVLDKPFWNINLPAFNLKILYGEMAAIIVEGSRVSSAKIQEAGYHFLFPDLKRALKDLLNKE